MKPDLAEYWRQKYLESKKEVERLQKVITAMEKMLDEDEAYAKEEVELLRQSGVEWYFGEHVNTAVQRLIEERNRLYDIVMRYMPYLVENS